MKITRKGGGSDSRENSSAVGTQEGKYEEDGNGHVNQSKKDNEYYPIEKMRSIIVMWIWKYSEDRYMHSLTKEAQR